MSLTDSHSFCRNRSIETKIAVSWFTRSDTSSNDPDFNLSAFCGVDIDDVLSTHEEVIRSSLWGVHNDSGCSALYSIPFRNCANYRSEIHCNKAHRFHWNQERSRIRKDQTTTAVIRSPPTSMDVKREKAKGVLNSQRVEPCNSFHQFFSFQ